MTNWHPTLGADRARYEGIVDALADDIATGRLQPGERLPTQRELASELDLAIGTVTRAYSEAQRRGLVVARVGRGTFVRDMRDPQTRWELGEALDPSVIDFGLLVPPRVGRDALVEGLRSAARGLGRQEDVLDLLGYQPHAGHPSHRKAGADWIERTGLEARPDHMLLCGSAQHALAATLSTLVQPGEAIFVEELTSPGIKDVASWLELRLHGLPMDRDGLIPEAFREAAATGTARVLYCMPTLHNPTTISMSRERRQAIAEIAMAHDVAIVEDGVHGLLPERPPLPLSAYAADHSYYITSLSKTVAPGIRVGYLLAPARAVPPIESALRATLWMTSPLLAEIAARWMRDGTADRILSEIRREMAVRRSAAAEILPGVGPAEGSLHLWMRLPPPWRPGEFVTAAQARGVRLSPTGIFTTHAGPEPGAVRICLSGADTLEETRRGLEVLGHLLALRRRRPA